MDGMMRLPGQRAIASPRLGGSPPITGTDTGYPWVDGDILYAADLNAAFNMVGANYADNGGFAVNQRGYVSGIALAATAFGHDRWKAGAGGCTYTFTQSGNPATTVTITAGSLQQVMEGAAFVGGTYTLSWTGTSQGRVGVGGYAASPVTASVTAGANTTIEFNTGTLGRVRFEAGATASPWVGLSPQQDIARCQRFYQTADFYAGQYNVAGSGNYINIYLSTAMRASPTVTVGSGVVTNASGPSVAALGGKTNNVLLAQFTTVATGQTFYTGTAIASADL